MEKYTKNVWEDRTVEYPNRYKMVTDTITGYVSLTEEPGKVDKVGTLVNAERMNNIENGIYNNQMFTYQTTLVSTSWILNSTTNLYEYNVADTNITSDTYVIIDLDIANCQKLEGISEVNSYDGGFIVSTTELPTLDIIVNVRYGLIVNVITNESGGTQNAGTN